MKTNKLFLAVIYIIVCGLSIIYLFPFIWLVRSSFMSIGQIFRIPPEWIPNPFRPDNYLAAFREAPFHLYFFNTFRIILINMLAVLFITPFSAYAFSRFNWKGRDTVFFVLLSSLMLPASVTLIPLFLIWNSLGFVNTFIPLVIPTWFGGGIYNIFLLRQFMMTIPRELDDAAEIDGANSFQVLLRVMIPLLRPALITIGLFCFLYHWNDFLSPLIYLSELKQFTISLGLQMYVGMHSARWHLLMAASTICVMPPIIVFFFGQKFFIEGITITGIKG